MFCSCFPLYYHNLLLYILSPMGTSVYVLEQKGGSDYHVTIFYHTDGALAYRDTLLQDDNQYQPLCSHHSPHPFLFLFQQYAAVYGIYRHLTPSDDSLPVIIDQDNFKERYFYGDLDAYLVQFYFLLRLISTNFAKKTYIYQFI